MTLHWKTTSVPNYMLNTLIFPFTNLKFCLDSLAKKKKKQESQLFDLHTQSRQTIENLRQ